MQTAQVRPRRRRLPHSLVLELAGAKQYVADSLHTMSNLKCTDSNLRAGAGLDNAPIVSPTEHAVWEARPLTILNLSPSRSEPGAVAAGLTEPVGTSAHQSRSSPGRAGVVNIQPMAVGLRSRLSTRTTVCSWGSTGNAGPLTRMACASLDTTRVAAGPQRAHDTTSTENVCAESRTPATACVITTSMSAYTLLPRP